MHLWSDVGQVGSSAALGWAFSLCLGIAWLADHWLVQTYSHDRRKLMRKEKEAPRPLEAKA